MTEKRKVFISYSSKEVKIAEFVCDFLERNFVSCWMAPRDITPGETYASQIVQAIRDCEILVLLASENTNLSGHVTNEVSIAFDDKKVIIPFKLQDIEFSDDYLYYIGRNHWIEAHLNMNAGLEQLLATIRGLTKNHSSPQYQPRPKQPQYVQQTAKPFTMWQQPVAQPKKEPSVRSGMLVWGIICLLLTGGFFSLMILAEALAMAFISLLMLELSIIFFILAKSPKNAPCLFGKSTGLKKSTFVIIYVCIALFATAVSAVVFPILFEAFF
ncbi:MAG: toll/interleukin-1 receptor domain-containing protein [Ruminococcaceae bacterium]|nr:toll/interleukin-1 receptor domain-containing protein [Oscillospiraceae bacterium]